jgi:hypothetical protein
LAKEPTETGTLQQTIGFALELDYDRELLTVLNVPLTLVANWPTITTMATTIKPSMTAYSTAVGPSSLTTKRWTAFTKPLMVCSFCDGFLYCHGTTPVNVFHQRRRKVR